LSSGEDVKCGLIIWECKDDYASYDPWNLNVYYNAVRVCPTIVESVANEDSGAGGSISNEGVSNDDALNSGGTIEV